MERFEEAFCNADDEAFNFLVTEHGFVRAERQVGRRSAQAGVVGRVIYRAADEGPRLGRAVSLSLAPLQRVLDLHVSKWASGPYPIEELHALEARGAFPHREHALYDAMLDADELLIEFTRLADALRSCGARFFDDDPELWNDLRTQRERRADAQAMEGRLALSRERFRAHDWSGVIELLGPVEARLGRAATARLASARRKQGGG